MLFASHINNWNDWQFGASRTLVKGTDFNCNTSICYGVGAANHALFQQLQSTLNQFAKLGLSAYSAQLTVDGFIGANTVSAARAAAAAALLPSPGTTKEQVAANAQVLQDGLQAFLGGVSAPRPVATAPTTTAPTQTAPTRVVTPATSTPIPSTQPLPQAAAAAATIYPASATPASAAAASLAPIVTTKKVPLWVWITASAVGVIVIGGVGYAILHEPAKKPSLARRRRR